MVGVVIGEEKEKRKDARRNFFPGHRLRRLFARRAPSKVNFHVHKFPGFLVSKRNK
jgi:hypothetical protein